MKFLRSALKSWRTTAAGLVPLAYVVLPMFGITLPPGTLEVVLGTVGVGLVASRDANVTSEQSGAK